MSREISVRPRYPSTRPKTILNDSGLRLDGRSPESVRPLFLKTRVVKQARGSSYVELGSTKIICSVYGPKPLSDAEFTKSGKLACSVQYTSFSAVQRRKPHGTTKDDSKELSTRVQQSIETGVRLETFPKSVVDVNVLILEDDGSVLPAAVIAASLALASAGIEMFDLVAASSLVLVGSQFVIDPTQAEESLAAGSLSLAYMPSMKDVTDVVLMSDALDGVPAAKRTDTYVKICFEACRQIHDLMRAVLLEDAKGSQ